MGRHRGGIMKKSTVIKKMVKVLKKWENSMLDAKCAHAVLDLLEKEGVITPPEVIVWHTKINGKRTPVFGMQWEPEKGNRPKVKKDIVNGKVKLGKEYLDPKNHKLTRKD